MTKKTKKFNFKSEYVLLGLAVVFLVGAVFVNANKNVIAQVTDNGISFSLSESSLLKVLDRLLPGDKEIAPEVDLTLGAQPGPDSFHGLETHNGIGLGFTHQTLIATSSNFCILPNTTGATTTVVSWSVNIKTNGLGAQAFDLSSTTASNRFSPVGGTGSSSPAFLHGKALTAGSGQTVFWDGILVSSTTAAVKNNDGSFFVFTEGAGDGVNIPNPFVLGPKEALVGKIATSSPGVFSGGYLTGTCSARLIKH